LAKINRTPASVAEDELVFQSGANVLVGDKNTGKSMWLSMIDYLFADDDSAESAFGEDLANKYESLAAQLLVGNESLEVSRNWKMAKLRGKIVVNGEPILPREFSHLLLEKSGIPLVHYPQGNPYAARKWPELGWRSLFRHMYRRQQYWADLADKQPESEQHACICMFLGLAPQLFSASRGELVSAEKQRQALEYEKEQFLSMLASISNELVSAESGLGVQITRDSVQHGIERLNGQISSLQESRLQILTRLAEAARSKVEANTNELAALETEWLSLNQRKGETVKESAKTRLQVSELSLYISSIENEIGRLERSRVAAEVIADIRVTTCPACDLPVEGRTARPNTCFLCGQELSLGSNDTGFKRIDLEIDHLLADLEESKGLIEVLKTHVTENDKEQIELDETMRSLNSRLRPYRQAAAAIETPELSAIDTGIGRLEEKINQLQRISGSLDRRNQLSQKIDQLTQSISLLESAISQESSHLDFSTSGDVLADGMNTYLNELKRLHPTSWNTAAEVSAHLTDRSLSLKVGQGSWRTKLGGTMRLYFLMAYHYALLSLTGGENRFYPGLLILDFPAAMEDGSTIADKENFVLEPLISLSSSSSQSVQIIAAGSAFQGLAGARRIELATRWVE
jgi:DNA repair exonuclease SbcCD ATPase subunit